MFTGIIECTGVVKEVKKELHNLHLLIQAPFIHELKIDQSVAHNGVCLTVVDIQPDYYVVTAIDETLRKTNLGHLQAGHLVNLERCMPANGRFDGHIVQGHVDQTAVCSEVREQGGSWIYSFSYEPVARQNITVGKGSICVNGVSLTVTDSHEHSFSVAIIPYTYEHTGFKQLKTGDLVNLEFDILGKYIGRWMEQYMQGRSAL